MISHQSALPQAKPGPLMVRSVPDMVPDHCSCSPPLCDIDNRQGVFLQFKKRSQSLNEWNSPCTSTEKELDALRYRLLLSRSHDRGWNGRNKSKTENEFHSSTTSRLTDNALRHFRVVVMSVCLESILTAAGDCSLVPCRKLCPSESLASVLGYLTVIRGH